MGQVGFTVVSVYSLKSGGGYHMWDVQLKGFFELLYVCLIITLRKIWTLRIILVAQHQ